MRALATAVALAMIAVACGTSGGGGGGSSTGGKGGTPATGSGGSLATGGSTGGSATGGSTGGVPGSTGGVAGGPTTGTATGGSTSTGGTSTGGTSGDAGHGGSSGGAGGAPSGGGTSGGCAAAAFCDDFEHGTTLGSEWMLDNSVTANTIEVVSTKAHSGMNSVHIKYGTAATATYFDAAKGFPFPGDAYWGRVWMFAMTGLESGHHVFIEARVGDGSDHTGVRALNTQGNGMVATNLESSDKGGTASVTLPQGTWTCFEWHVTGGIHLYMNGTEVPGTAQTNWTIPHMTKQRLGIQRYASGSAGEIWYDDYAVGANRIGCE